MLQDGSMVCKGALGCDLLCSLPGLLPALYWGQYQLKSSQVSPVVPVSTGAVRCTATLQAPTALLPNLRWL